MVDIQLLQVFKVAQIDVLDAGLADVEYGDVGVLRQVERLHVCTVDRQALQIWAS